MNAHLEHMAGKSAPLPPFRLKAHNFGLGGDEPSLAWFIDRAGRPWVAPSVEYVLANIEHFENERDQHRLLSGAAEDYGFDDAWILIDGRDADDPRFDLLDDVGRLLLAGATHHAAFLAAQQLQEIPGWTSGFRYLRRRNGRACTGLLWDWRHEGPLELMALAEGVARVMARSHIGLCSIPLEEAVRRLDQFSAADQADLLAGLPFPDDVRRNAERFDGQSTAHSTEVGQG